jgi:hypothetical protein
MPAVEQDGLDQRRRAQRCPPVKARAAVEADPLPAVRLGGVSAQGQQ